MRDDERADLIAALLRERAGYEAKGLTKRVEEVNRELTALGHEAKPPAKRAASRRR